MNEQVQRMGAVLSAYLDMIKGTLGDQYAVTLVGRHRFGPAHILIGDDDEDVVIKSMQDMQAMATTVFDNRPYLGEPPLTEVQGVPIAPPHERVCPRCVGVIADDATQCPVCGCLTPL